ncbi:hypothetical protein [Embleya hyalina]|uniref:Uncharacterized protein n=1 Tax=Embleya hyalina TaxID=516124 RepID=A0A401YJB7_9ACTN|nr:hypothetical protein [Embleya hyalina]GCD94668.1 hypothetical protein EHYA_02337 [Embleya hyalina]
MTDEKPVPKSKAKARKAPAVQSSVLAAALQDAMNGSFLNSGTDSTAALLAQMGGGSGSGGGSGATSSGPPFKTAAAAVPAPAAEPEPKPEPEPEPKPEPEEAAPDATSGVAADTAPEPEPASEPEAVHAAASPIVEPVPARAEPVQVTEHVSDTKPVAASESVQASTPEPEFARAAASTAAGSGSVASVPAEASPPRPRREVEPDEEPVLARLARFEVSREEAQAPTPRPEPVSTPAPAARAERTPDRAAEPAPRAAAPTRSAPAAQPAKTSAPAKAASAPRASRRNAPAPAAPAPVATGSADEQSAHAALLESFLDARINSKGWETWGFRLLPDVKARLGKRLTADKRSSQNRRLALGHYLNAALLELPEDNDEQIEMIRSFLRARGGITDPSQSSSYRVSPAVYELARDLDTELTATEKRGLVVYLFSAAVELFLERLDAEGALGRPEIFSPQQ